MFIIDFDDTLFDTQAFKVARVKKLQELGVSEEVFWQSYHDAYHDKKKDIYSYNDKRHAEALARHGFDKELILCAFKSAKNGIKRFLFPDAVDFLEQLKLSKRKLILLSLGDPEFQMMKVAATEISRYFNGIYILNTTKASVVDTILRDHEQSGQVWLINDKIEESKQLVSQFPIIKPILKVSPVFGEDRYKTSAIPYFFNLNQIREYVQQGL